MMQDLSYFSTISTDDNQTEVLLDATHASSVPANCSSEVKRKRSVKNDKMEGYADELVLSILKSSTNDMDDEKAKMFVQV